MRIFKLLIVSIVAVAFFSCEPTYVKEYSWAYPIAGDWKLRAYNDGVEVDWYDGPFEIKIYNSSFGKDSIWIDDYATTSSNGNFWSTKFKAAVNMTDKTFSTTGSKNAVTGYPISIKVSNGKVVGTDSITMDVEFGDEAGVIYQLAGHRIVGYDEYMH
jgi:hypothetical protein